MQIDYTKYTRLADVVYTHGQRMVLVSRFKSFFKKLKSDKNGRWENFLINDKIPELIKAYYDFRKNAIGNFAETDIQKAIELIENYAKKEGMI